MTDLLDLHEAAKLIGVPAPSLRRSLAQGKIPGTQVKQGLRSVWRVSKASIKAYLKQREGSGGDYDQLIAQWEREQANGYHSGRHVGPRGIETNTRGMGYFWKALGQDPEVSAITPENLKIALSNIPVDYIKKNCHYWQRMHLWKGFKSFYNLLIRLGLRSESDLIAIKAVRPAKRVFPARRTSLKADALHDLLEANETFLDGRSKFDQALMKTAILIMSLSGLRRSEALDLEVSQVDLERGLLRVIDGKGHKDRVAGMPTALIDQLRVWLHRWRPSTKHPQILIMADGRPLTETAIQQRIARLRKKAGIDITLHGLRRTCATLMVDSGVPLVHVQRNLGHSDIKTTMSYVMTDAETAAESFRRFEF